MFETNILEPIYTKNSRILILGSFPSKKSREGGFYYLNKRNRFWYVLENIYNYGFKEAINNKEYDSVINKLNELGIALYDVISYCNIDKSKDNSITNAIVTNSNNIINSPNITKIYFNGRKAYSIFLKEYNTDKELILLPSTSSANVRCKNDMLISEWNKINE